MGVIALVIALVALAGMVVAVPSLVPTPIRSAIGLGPKRIAPAPSISASGSYAFLAHQPGDSQAPVGYDPCRVIHLRVNLDRAPEGALALVSEATSRIEQATGLRFSYDGTTEARPQWKNASVPILLGRAHSTPVLVDWATPGDVPELAGDVAGIGGSIPVADSGGRVRFVTGGISLDADLFEVLSRTEDGRREALAIVMHEFGHVVGLAHVHDPAELMNEDNLGLLDFGPGDLAGLARVGSTSCA